jgi:hypothetical protein
MDRVGTGDGLGDGEVGELVGEVDEEGDGEWDSLLGAGPSGWAPLSAHAVVRAANVAAIAIRRFMGCLLRWEHAHAADRTQLENPALVTVR